ncbi:MAG: glycosyltransferase family 61 protein [Candidatus Endonucleobacter bathymodioli]|uniref:Glycosyltransferase family 61 protein n=1 Tax=Candidatus Endonucleibacter bathymodioli TaxID=539814 RepID=A0AA90NVL4_9GAMM|nr:glycosyltransferase family 61 protein [Candidatus Endonucleobacter bathymodioli]
MIDRFLPSMLRLYRAKLSRFYVARVVRHCAHVGLVFLYRLKCIAIGQMKGGKFRFFTPEQFGRQYFPMCEILVPEKHVVIDGPRSSYKHSFGFNAELRIKFLMPELRTLCLNDAVAIGGTGFLIVQGGVMLPELFDPEKDTCLAETYGVVKIIDEGSAIRFYTSKPALERNEAISLLGQCANNYAHWMTELLPKLLMVDASSRYDGWPLLIDASAVRSFEECIRLFNTKRRKIIVVDSWAPVILTKVVHVSAPAYEPYRPDRIKKQEACNYINIFSPEVMKMLRDEAHRVVKAESVVPYRRVYLDRGKAGNLRSITNREQVNGVLRDYKFETIEPAKLSISEQINVCREAECIIAPIGAALINMIFATEGCKVFALVGKYDYGNYYYYSNLAGVLGCEFYYVLGEPVTAGGQDMHFDYTVDIEGLRASLEAGL